MRLIERLETQKRVFFSYHNRPQKADAVRPSFQIARTDRIGIVVQGPIVVESDFTLQSLLILRKAFPDAKILVSAWSSEDQAYLRKIEEQGFALLVNSPPQNPGPRHINWQIYATLQGLQKLATDCDFLLKTRTDQRIYSADAAGLLLTLLNSFPVSPGFKQKGRIIGSSLNSFRYRLYDLSDMFIFGFTDDVIRFWSAPFDPRPKTFFSREPGTFRELAQWNICEMYLTSKYLESIGRELKWTLEDSWAAWKEHFCVADATSLNLFWYKYRRYLEYRYKSYGGNPLLEEIDFPFWMSLYGADLSAVEIPETYLDLPLEAKQLEGRVDHV